MRILTTLLVLCHTAFAADAPAVALERGVELFEIHGDTDAAIAALGAVLADARSTPQQRGEATLTLALCYDEKGSINTAIALSRKLAARPQGVEPFAAAATELAMDLAVSAPPETEAAFSADAARMGDLVLLLDAAIKSADLPAAKTLVQDMQFVAESIAFEAGLTTPGIKKSRPSNQAGKPITQTITDFAATLAEGNFPVLQDAGKALAKFRNRAQTYERGDFAIALYRDRDALISALADGDGKRIATLASELATVLSPIAAGATAGDLASFAAAERAMLQRIATLAADGKVNEARVAHRTAWLAFHRAFETGRALRIPRREGIEPRAMSAFIGALTFVEAAIADLQQNHLAAARSEMSAGAAALEVIAGNPKTRSRAQESARRIREAIRELDAGDEDGAASLLNAELFF